MIYRERAKLSGEREGAPAAASDALLSMDEMADHQTWGGLLFSIRAISPAELIINPGVSLSSLLQIVVSRCLNWIL